MKRSEEAEKLIENKEYNKAIDIINSLINENPKDVKWLLKRADIYYLQQHYAKALNDYTRALKLDPNCKNLASKIEMIKEILKFQALDIYGSTNLNKDPWLDD